MEDTDTEKTSGVFNWSSPPEYYNYPFDRVIFTTLHPETGELTEETEFANSWKWGNEEVSTRFYWTEDNAWVRRDTGWKESGFDNEGQQLRSLVNKYDLPYSTPLRAVQEIAKLTKEQEESEQKHREQRRLNTEYLEALEATSYEHKGLIKKQKETKKKVKGFLKLIEKYLTHGPNCMVPTLKALGRTRVKSQCNCGLKEALESIKL